MHYTCTPTFHCAVLWRLLTAGWLAPGGAVSVSGCRKSVGTKSRLGGLEMDGRREALGDWMEPSRATSYESVQPRGYNN